MTEAEEGYLMARLGMCRAEVRKWAETLEHDEDATEAQLEVARYLNMANVGLNLAIKTLEADKETA